MARYIDADKFEQTIKGKELFQGYFDNGFIYDELHRQPTADVAEVKHGQWIYDVKYYSCSICAGKRFNLSLGTDAEFCPYCGAKMDGGKEE